MSIWFLTIFTLEGSIASQVLSTPEAGNLTELYVALVFFGTLAVVYGFTPESVNDSASLNPNSVITRIPKVGRLLEELTRGTRRSFLRFRWVWYLLVVVVIFVDLLLGAFIGGTIITTQALGSEAGGYAINAPMDFSFSNKSPLSQDVAIVVFLHNTLTDELEFVAGLSINVSVTASVYNVTTASSIDHMDFAFQSQVLSNSSLDANTAEQFISLDHKSAGEWSYCCSYIAFPSGGDYSPLLVVTMFNGSSFDMEQTYTNFHLSIQPISSISQILSNRVSSLLTIALYFFGVIESARLIHVVWRRASRTDLPQF